MTQFLVYNNMNYNYYKEKCWKMKKILCVIMAVVLFSFMLVSCNQKTEDGFMKAESQTCDFYFTYPDTWDLTYNDGMLAIRNPEDKTGANVVGYSFFHNLDDEPSAEQYWDIYKAQFEDTFTTMLVTKNEETTLSGVIARHVYYTVDMGKDSFNCQTIICVYAGRVYTLTLTQGVETEENKEFYNDHGDEFLEIAKTFRIGA